MIDDVIDPRETRPGGVPRAGDGRGQAGRAAVEEVGRGAGMSLGERLAAGSNRLTDRLRHRDAFAQRRGRRRDRRPVGPAGPQALPAHHLPPQRGAGAHAGVVRAGGWARLRALGGRRRQGQAHPQPAAGAGRTVRRAGQAAGAEHRGAGAGAGQRGRGAGRGRHPGQLRPRAPPVRERRRAPGRRRSCTWRSRPRGAGDAREPRRPGRHHLLDLRRDRQPRPVPGDPLHAGRVRGRGASHRGRGRRR